MEFQEIVPFFKDNHLGVVSTKQSDGAIHSSVVVCGVYCECVAFVAVYPRSQKIRNLSRNPACTLLAVSDDGARYVVVEGRADLFDYRNTDREKMRILLRQVYSACSRMSHPDWEEFDIAMVYQKATVVLIHPNRVYGLLT